MISFIRKKNVLKYFVLFFLCSSFAAGCRSTPQREQSPDSKFKQFTFLLFQQEVSSNTLNLHYTLRFPERYGIKNIPDSFGSFSTDSVSALASIENCQAALLKFPYEKLSSENQLTYDILDHYLRTAKKGCRFLLYEEPLSPVTGIQSQLPVLLAEFQFYSKKDIDTYLNLLRSTPSYFQSLIDFEQAKAKKGIFLSNTISNKVLEQCNSFLQMGEKNYLFSTFDSRISALSFLSDSEKNDYRKKNETYIKKYFIPSYKKLADSISILKRNSKNPVGVCSYPEGKQYYEYVVERETGSSRNIPQIKSLIKKQMARDAKAIRLFSSSPFSTDLTNMKKLSPSDILYDLKNKIHPAFPLPTSVNETIKFVPKEMEPYLSPAFYMIPCMDDSSENVIYINRAHISNGLNLYTTLAHEGYPGHLYQTTYFSRKNKEPLRSLLNFGGYAEGWATYAEMCSYYLAPVDKKQAAFAQKSNSYFLGLYACADIGIHYDNWSLNDTISFFSKHGFNHNETINEIYNIIVSDPGNYLKYYVGYIEFLQLKREMIQHDKDQFSQASFHKKILDIGPAPFDIIRKYIKRDADASRFILYLRSPYLLRSLQL